MARQPDHRRRDHIAQPEGVPAEKPKDKAQNGPQQREERPECPLAQPVKMGGNARPADRHAQPEGKGPRRQCQRHRPDMGVGSQATGKGVGHPRAQHHRITHRPGGQRHHNRQQARRLAPFKPVAGVAPEAKARPLKHKAESRPQQERQGQRTAQRIGGRQGQRQKCNQRQRGGGGDEAGNRHQQALGVKRRARSEPRPQANNKELRVTGRSRPFRRDWSPARRPHCRIRSTSRHSSSRHSQGFWSARTRCATTARQSGNR